MATKGRAAPKPPTLSMLPVLNRMKRLTRGLRLAFSEAASHCFAEVNARAPMAVTLHRYGRPGRRFDHWFLTWPRHSAEIAASHADLQHATEYGAYGVALTAASHILDLQFVERAYKGTGVDMYLCEDQASLFQRAVRLEVSGVLRGDRTALTQRVRQKTEQSKQSDDQGTRALVVVVEFSELMLGWEERDGNPNP